jgi:hypothetical protein
MKLCMKNRYLLIFFLSLLVTFNLIESSILQDTLAPLKEAIKDGQTLPLSELPILNLVPLPGSIKQELDKIEIIAPQLIFDSSTMSAELSGGAILLGQPVVIKIRMAYGEKGAVGADDAFLKQIKPNDKVDMKAVASDLQELANNTTANMPGSEEEGSKQGKISQQAPKVGGPTIGGQRAYQAQQQLAPQKDINIPVKTAEEIVKNVNETKSKFEQLRTQASGMMKGGATQVKAKIGSEAKKQLEKINFALFVGIPQVKFAALDPSLSFLDIISLSNLAFVVATGDYFDKTWVRTFYKGLNLFGTARMSGPLEKINSVIGSNLTEISLHGVVDPTLFGSSLTAELPGKVKLGKYLETTGLLLRLQLVQASVPIAVSIMTGLNIYVPKQEQPLGLRAGISYVPPTELVLGGWMEGMWKNPFGVPYISIGEVGIQAGTDIESAVSTLGILSLSRIGMRGRMGWANKFVEIAMSISLSTARPDLMIKGSFEGGLYLHELVEGGAKIIDESARIGGKNIKLSENVKGKIPQLGFKSAELYISPIDVSLAGRYYKQGITISGAIDILGVTTALRFAIDTNKYVIEGLGYMSNIDLKFFKITGAGPDKKRGTEDDGPIVIFKVQPSPPFAEFFIDGRVELDKKILGGAYGDARVSISVKGIEFWIKAMLFDQFMTQLEVSAPNFIKPSEWKVIGKFEQSALDVWAKLLAEGAQEIAKQASESIPKAKAKLDEAKQKLDAIGKEKEKIKRENEKNMSGVIKGMQAKLDTLKREKDALEDQIAKCKGTIPSQAQEEASLRVDSIKEKLISAADIAIQKADLEKQGFNQNQIDLILQKVWAEKAAEELEGLLAGFNIVAAQKKALTELVKSSLANKNYFEERLKSLQGVPETIENQIEYVLDKEVKDGMPTSYKTVVREIIWIKYYQLKAPTAVPSALKTSATPQVKGVTDYAAQQRLKMFRDLANTAKTELARRRVENPQDLMVMRVELFEQLLKTILRQMLLTEFESTEVPSIVTSYRNELQAQIQPVKAVSKKTAPISTLGGNSK